MDLDENNLAYSAKKIRGFKCVFCVTTTSVSLFGLILTQVSPE